MEILEVAEEHPCHWGSCRHDEAMQIAPADDPLEFLTRNQHGDAGTVGCVAFHCLAQIYNDDIALFRVDIDAIEIPVWITAGDKLQDIVVQAALGDELSRTRVAL
ncbi:hypothetical protein L614_002900000130 [Ochrobactrum sp. J50]|nr:hypothetical protein L614_002900000130 [Ochrobactrum sp. J50]